MKAPASGKPLPETSEPIAADVARASEPPPLVLINRCTLRMQPDDAKVRGLESGGVMFPRLVGQTRSLFSLQFGTGFQFL